MISLMTQNKRDGKVIILANQKGGVGKTTSTSMICNVITTPTFNKKVLLIDWDLQRNSTILAGKTYGTNFPQSVMKSAFEGDLRAGIVSLNENLDFIAGEKDTRIFSDNLVEMYPKGTKNYMYNRTFYFKKLLDEVRYNYDYVFIDVPPSTDLKVDNLMVCADYTVIVQETQPFSYEGSVDIVFEYLATLAEDFGSEVNFEVAGVLPVLLQTTSNLHDKIVKKTYDKFGRQFTFSTNIKSYQRLQLYAENGIEVIDYHDRRVFAVFADVFTELEERIKLFESEGGIPDDYLYTPIYLNNNKLTKLAKEMDLEMFVPEDYKIK